MSIKARLRRLLQALYVGLLLPTFGTAAMDVYAAQRPIMEPARAGAHAAMAGYFAALASPVYWSVRLLLQQVPELRARLHEMATCSPVWAHLVAHWDELCELMDAEAPDWPKHGSRAPKTYRRMRELIEGES